jgi:hypothetical protein
MIAVSPFSIHPKRSTEVKAKNIIDNFRIDLCPFNIMGVIRNQKWSYSCIFIDDFLILSAASRKISFIRV